MQSTAKLRYIRIAPRKVRLVADLIRGRKVQEAQKRLDFTVRGAALPVLKTLKSAVASAKENFQAEEDNLYILKITVDEGPKLKRYRARARGAAYPIQKKTSHVTIILDEIKEKKREEEKPKKSATPVAKDLAEVKSEQKAAALKETEQPAKQDFRQRPEKSAPKSKKESGMKRFFRRKVI